MKHGIEFLAQYFIEPVYDSKAHVEKRHYQSLL